MTEANTAVEPVAVVSAEAEDTAAAATGQKRAADGAPADEPAAKVASTGAEAPGGVTFVAAARTSQQRTQHVHNLQGPAKLHHDGEECKIPQGPVCCDHAAMLAHIVQVMQQKQNQQLVQSLGKMLSKHRKLRAINLATEGLRLQMTC